MENDLACVCQLCKDGDGLPRCMFCGQFVGYDWILDSSYVDAEQWSTNEDGILTLHINHYHVKCKKQYKKESANAIQE